MRLCDVNVLVYAHREDAADHQLYRDWLHDLINGAESYGVSDLVLSGFLRVVTHPAVFANPTPTAQALDFANQLRNQPNCVLISPGVRHWEIFVDLCTRAASRGNLVPDAYHAALAIESGSEWMTTDRGFARFPGLRWQHPLEA
ncbi:MAG: type II toxin-antitoxin system VapC family toxin [Gemmatimonadota bacterium]